LLEEVLEVFFGPGGWEVLDVKVASLLGVLISDHLLEFLLGSLLLGKEFSDVKLDGLTVFLSHVFSVENLNSLGDCLWTMILVSWILIADETELTHIVLVNFHLLDRTVSGEHGVDVSFTSLLWDVLEIQVVGQFSSNFSSFFDLELHDTFVLEGIMTLLGVFFVFEADESKSFLGVISIQSNLDTLDLTESGELFAEGSVVDCG